MNAIRQTIYLGLLLVTTSCVTNSRSGLEGVWEFPPPDSRDLDKSGKQVLVLQGCSFALDDDWTNGKTGSAPISGVWTLTNSVIVLKVKHTESCKIRENTEIKWKIAEMTSNTMSVVDVDDESKTMMILKRSP